MVEKLTPASASATRLPPHDSATSMAPTPAAPTPTASAEVPMRCALADEAHELDLHIYHILAAPLGVHADRWIGRFTTLADHSKISMLTAAGLAIVGGNRGRLSAITGIAAVAITSVTANAVVKPIARRHRPQRHPQHPSGQPGTSHHVLMPTSRSFPSGHTAAACAFASAVAAVWPSAGAGTGVVAAAVGYSRIHVGVHYPGDVAGGALLGIAIGTAVGQLLPPRLTAAVPGFAAVNG